jgi:tetratricopeptide (TPR) repeat protein
VLGQPDTPRFPLSHAGAMLEGAILASFQGDNDEARALGEACLALYRSLGRPSEESSALILLGNVLQSGGAFDEARACHEQALAIARSRDAKGPQAICLVNLANVDLLRGDAAAARTGLVHALEVLADNCDATAGVYAHEMLGQLDLRDGAFIAARDRFATARAAARRTGDVMQTAKTTMLLGRIDVALMDFDGGLTQLADGLDRLHRLAQKEETLLALDMAAEALQRAGDFASAARLRAATRVARNAYGFHWPPLDRAVHDQDERDALPVLGADELAAAQREGESWSLAQAVDHALARLAGAATSRDGAGARSAPDRIAGTE